MAYTETDLEVVKDAIIELAAGKRVGKIVFSNGGVVEYATTSPDALERLRSDIWSELNSASGNSRHLPTITSKGL